MKSHIKAKEKINNTKIISVIITAYNRKQFLKYAVESVLNQNFRKQDYEIIVIKNFVTEFDEQWKSKGIKLIYKKEGSMGEFLTLGILHSKGKIIAFLDDDDTFEREKLKTIVNIFSRYPNLVYYHNDYTAIYENKINFNMPHIDKITFIYNSSKKSIYRFILLGYYFNLSCLSIKRQLAIENINYIKKIIDDPDDAFGYFALSSEGKILCDNLRLTNYRIHENNTSRLNQLGNNTHYKREYKMYHYILKNFLLRKRMKIPLKALHSRVIRNYMDNAVLTSKNIKINELINYLKNYSIPYLIYCGRVDLFILLIILTKLDKTKAKIILSKREGLKTT